MNGNEHRVRIDSWMSGRVLYFIRHGQYESEGPGAGLLTALGRKQARHLGRHFQRSPIDAISSSDLPRAVETADIMADTMGISSVRRHRVLREVIPARVLGMNVSRQKVLDGQKRIERVVTRFFKTSRQPRQEIVVCHGNLIRALVCSVTGAPMSRFVHMLTHHGGVTCFAISKRGARLVAYNVIEHLPMPMRSYL
jgi:serine/threonine-protein phosphatase PGAM5